MEYIETSLKAGLICPMSSPAEEPVSSPGQEGRVPKTLH